MDILDMTKYRPPEWNREEEIWKVSIKVNPKEYKVYSFEYYDDALLFYISAKGNKDENTSK